ncbi:MAG: class I SAM-dependent methyltransferase [Myxococcota bacterium]
MSIKDHMGSPDRFGYEWARYSEILPESRLQLQRWFGSTGLHTCAGKSVMDVGCGMGRNPYWMLKAGAKELLAVDADDNSLAAAQKNLAEFDQARVQKCSVYNLNPKEQGTFERVTCIGVLHHLEHPELALQKLWSCVKPGGDLILWCYALEGNRGLLPLIQLLRSIGARAPLWLTHALAKAITLVAWPLILWWPWRNEYYKRLKVLSFKNVESIIFDQILPKIANYWTKEDMQRLTSGLSGADVFLEFVQGNSWHVRALKHEVSVE